MAKTTKKTSGKKSATSGKKSATSGKKSATSGKKSATSGKKPTVDFSDLEPHDIARLVVSTGLMAKASGGPVDVGTGSMNGVEGVMVWIPGYRIEGGELVAIEEDDGEKDA